MKVDESWSCNFDAVDLVAIGEMLDDLPRDIAGFMRAGFARRIATLLAKSPWLGSRVRSTVSSIARSATASASAGSSARESCTNCATVDFMIACRKPLLEARCLSARTGDSTPLCSVAQTSKTTRLDRHRSTSEPCAQRVRPQAPDAASQGRYVALCDRNSAAEAAYDNGQPCAPLVR